MSSSTDLARKMVGELRDNPSYRLAVTEVTGQACDVLTLRSNGEWVEFEIKSSKADFRKEIRAIEAALVPEEEKRLDFVAYYDKYRHISNAKISKHSIYLKPSTEHKFGLWKSFVPSRYYFAVTDDLLDYAITTIVSMKLPYGVATLDGEIIKNAKKLELHIDYQTMINIACRAFGEKPLEEQPK